MARTIELAGKTVAAIQAIWDRDHGYRNQGWYLRVRHEDGEEIDDLDCSICDLPHDAEDEKIIAGVMEWLFDPDDMNGEDEATMRAMIEVKR